MSVRSDGQVFVLEGGKCDGSRWTTRARCGPHRVQLLQSAMARRNGSGLPTGRTGAVYWPIAISSGDSIGGKMTRSTAPRSGIGTAPRLWIDMKI